MKNETIVDRVVERLKAQPLGDLITEEDLHDIVKDAIPKVFFERRTVFVGSGYHEKTQEIDPLIVEVMRGLMEEAARSAVKEWLAENTEVMVAHWKTVIDTGLMTYVQKIQDDAATIQVKAALVGFMTNINNERSRNGLPPLYL